MTESLRPITLDVPDKVETSRLVIRPFDRGNAEALSAAVDESREHIRPWLPWWNSHREIGETIEFCVRSRAGWLTRENFGGGIFRKEDNVLLGGIGVHPRDWAVRSFEIGYWLRVGATGQGYMREAAQAMTRLAFESLDAERVYIRCDARNDASRRVAESCGYVFEGTHRHDARSTDGGLRDTLWFSMLRAEYEAARLAAGDQS